MYDSDGMVTSFASDWHYPCVCSPHHNVGSATNSRPGGKFASNCTGAVVECCAVCGLLSMGNRTISNFSPWWI